MTEQFSPATLAGKDFTELIHKYRGEAGGLIPLLQEVQSLLGYLPREALERIASELHLSLAKVLGVASFYAQFSLKPRGQYVIRVCNGTACHVRGSAGIFAALQEKLGLEEGGMTPDGSFTLEQVACIGACSLSPVLRVNEDSYGRLTREQLEQILEQYRNKAES